MGYGRIAVNTLRWDNAGTPTDLDVGTIANTTSPVFTGDVTLTGDNYNVVFDASDNALEFADSAKAIFGTGSDLSIYHDSNNSAINHNGTGDFYIQSNNNLYIRNFGGDNYIRAIEDGAVELYHDNSKSLETTATGVTVSGSVTDDKGNLRDIPRQPEAGAYTLVVTDAGQVVANSTGGWTIPASVFYAGATVTLLNDSASAQNVTASALTSLWNGADGANIKASTIALGARSMATIWFESASVGYIQGSAITVS